MYTEGDFIVIEESDYLPLGPKCVSYVTSAAQSGLYVFHLTRAIAWAYEHWLADQRASDDGWPPQVWE